MRVGAQAAQFSEPEQMLIYFQIVMVGQSKEAYEANIRNRNDRKASTNVMSQTQYPKTDTVNANIRCLNCNEDGNLSFMCNKTSIKCSVSISDRAGDQASIC